jgi:hypothetical protein
MKCEKNSNLRKKKLGPHIGLEVLLTAGIFCMTTHHERFVAPIQILASKIPFLTKNACKREEEYEEISG